MEYKNLPIVSLGKYPIRYCIASCPRSATRYIATILNDMGLNCGHEQYFTPQENILNSIIPYFGDSSWLSIPFLDRLPKEAVLFHQTRDPLKTINSCLTAGKRGRFGSYNKEIEPSYPWFAFHWHHSLDWDWPDNTPLGMENYWYYKWHSLIDDAGERHVQRGGTYFRYRIEDIGVDLLSQIYEILGQDFSPEKAQSVLDRVHKTVNKRGNPADYTSEVLTDLVKELAQSYGYDYL